MNEQLKNRMRNWSGSILFKGITVLILGLLIMIPAGSVKNLLAEREARKYSVRREVISTWGGRQVIAGPVLAVPFMKPETEITEKGRETVLIRHWAYILPEVLEIKGKMKSELRQKGIYEIELYSGEFTISGTFPGNLQEIITVPGAEILAEEAVLSVGLGDVKGLSSGALLRWNGEEREFSGGSGFQGLLPAGINASVFPGEGPIDKFSIDLELKGGESISFVPAGRETSVSLSSDWHSPGFSGAFLPSERVLNNESFEAKWKIHALARNFPQNWTDLQIDGADLEAAAFGVDFLNPVDSYLKNHRAIKYRLMFILIPFTAVFIFECLTGRRVHPFQYLMTGFSISMFFLLLLSLSEHTGFNTAYILSSAASAALTSVYAGYVMERRLGGFIMAAVNMLLYGYLYISLASEDYALLIGSAGLLVILAFVMFLTRKLNWYNM